MSTKPRPEFLALAEKCGATLTGKPDGSEAITVVFSIKAWADFDAAQKSTWTEGYKHGLWQGQNCAKPAASGEPVAWVNGAALKSAAVSRERGGPYDLHTWSESRTTHHDTPLTAATAQPASALVPLTDEQAESLIENSDGRWHDGEFRIDGPDLMKLLRDAAQPAPARVPLTDEQAMEIAVTATPPGSMASRHQIVEAIRLAERHHGIFPSKENPL